MKLVVTTVLRLADWEGLKARKIIAQGKASLRATPWFNRSQHFQAVKGQQISAMQRRNAAKVYSCRAIALLQNPFMRRSIALSFGIAVTITLLAGCGGDNRKERAARSFLEQEDLRLAQFAQKSSAKTGWFSTASAVVDAAFMLTLDKRQALMPPDNSPVVLSVIGCDVEASGTNLILRTSALLGLNSWECEFQMKTNHLTVIRQAKMPQMSLWWLAVRVTSAERKTLDGTNSMVLSGTLLDLQQQQPPPR